MFVLTISAQLALATAPVVAQEFTTNQTTAVNRRHSAALTAITTRSSSTHLEASARLRQSAETPLIPSPPEGVVDLKFGEMFKPIGARGLEFSDKLRSLDGKRVRMLGYMVQQSRPVPWTFLLSPVPLSLHEAEYGFAEDMPATIVHVITQRNSTPIVPYTPGLMLLTGTLSVGNREEGDGRISTARLALDPPTSEQRATIAQLNRRSQTISTNTVSR